jgi:hypothetical protein
MLNTRYLNEIIKSLEPWWEECEKRIVTYVENKMQKFDGIVVPKAIE